VLDAEFSIGYGRVDEVDAALALAGVALVEIPRGLVPGGQRRSRAIALGWAPGVLPDFFLGPHGVIEGPSLLTRDARRHRSCSQ
jgi:hypothetical protein